MSMGSFHRTNSNRHLQSLERTISSSNKSEIKQAIFLQSVNKLVRMRILNLQWLNQLSKSKFNLEYKGEQELSKFLLPKLEA